MSVSAERESAFETLFLTYHARLVAYARRFLPDEAEAEDLVQESFMKYWDNYSFRLDMDASRMLFTITRNSCLDYLKKRRPNVVTGLALEDFVGEELLYNWDFHYDANQEDRVIAELYGQINHVLDGLPSRCREVFEMSRFQGLTNKEIAAKLQISHTAVEKHIRKALAAFEKSLKDNPSILYVMAVLSLIQQLYN